MPSTRWSDTELEHFHREFREHKEAFLRHDREEQEFRQRVLDAFPDADTLKHRLYHEKMMEAAEEQKQFYRDLRMKLATLGISGTVVVLLGVLIAGAILKLKSMLGIPQ